MMILSTIVAAVLMLGYSDNPPNGRTGAPGESTCSECHSGGGSINGNITIQGLPATVSPSTPYDISVVIAYTSGTPLTAGFQMVALNGANTNIGSFSNLGPAVATETFNQRTYVEHRPAQAFGGGNEVTYTFRWTSPANTSNNNITFYAIANLANGNNSSSGDRVITTTAQSLFQTIQGDPLEVDIINIQHVTCNGGSNGSATAIASGGIIPYTYNWSNGGTSAVLNNVPAGAYTVTVTDNNAETATATVTITQPAPIIINLVFSEPIDCLNPTAEIVVQATGGTAPLSYNWSNGASGTNITVAQAGTYVVTVSDANSCSSTLSVQIEGDTDAPVISAGPDLYLYCIKEGITLEGSGPVGPDYTVSWLTLSGNIVSGEGTYTPLVDAIGEYLLLVVNADNGCSSVDTAFITGASPELFASATSGNVQCFGENNGTASAQATGGNPGYSYLWSNGAATQQITGLAPGVYTVTVTDNLGCTDTASVTITQPAQLTAIMTITHETAPGAQDGTASASLTGGTACAYEWSNGSNGQEITGLAPGTYTVTVIDCNGCTASATGTVIAFDCGFTVSASAEHVLCYGGSNGSITSVLNGGSMPFSYLWSNGQTTANLVNIPAGNYSLTVTDANNCTATVSATVTEPTQVTAQVTTTPVSEEDANDGTCTAVADGGTPPYTYLWSNGSATPVITGLAPGNYQVTVTDHNGCTTTAEGFISDPACLLDVSTGISAGISCAGDATGQIWVSVDEGTPPYTITWSNGADTDTISGLVAGSYGVTITDATGCREQATVVLSEPTPIQLDADILPTLAGASLGRIRTTASGGTGTLTYTWENGDTTPDRTGLSAGSYSVTVTDENGCSITESIVIAEVDCTLSAEATQVEAVTCFGGDDGSAEVIFSDGHGHTALLWSNAAGTSLIDDLTAGIYSVTLTDELGCTISDTVTVTEPAALSYTIIELVDQLNVDGTGKIVLAPAGGTAPYTYNWTLDGQPFTDPLEDLFAGAYQATITDAAGCTLETEVFVLEVLSSTGNTRLQDLVKVYPNPASTYLFVELQGYEESGSADIRLTDLNGRVLYRALSPWSDNLLRIPLENLVPGLYFLQLQTDESGAAFRFVKN